DALVVGAAHVERILELLPEGGGDIGRCRHGRLLARGGGSADQLGVFRIDRGRATAGRAGGDLPDQQEPAEDQQTQSRRAQAERGAHHDRLMAKLSTYSAGLPGSKALPITTMVFFDGSGGVSPISFIMPAVSVARNTSDATLA